MLRFSECAPSILITKLTSRLDIKEAGARSLSAAEKLQLSDSNQGIVYRLLTIGDEMRNLLLATCALVTASASALAADLPVRSTTPDSASAAAPFSWTGFYGGGSIALARVDSEFNDYNGRFRSYDDIAYGMQSDAGLFSVNAGYNWQMGAFVVGLEGDIGYLTAEKKIGPYGAAELSDYYIKTKMDALGSVRARLGYAFDRALIYATAGLAYGHVDSTAYNAFAGVNTLKVSDWRTGWVAGAGIEYAITNNWTARAEGLYYDLGENKRQWDSDAVYVIGVETTALVARIGVNYRFGGSAALVAASY